MTVSARAAALLLLAASPVLPACGPGADAGDGAAADTAAIAPPDRAGTLPRLANPEAVRERLRESYPDALREQGVGGEVRLRILISAEGLPLAIELERASGQPALDAASLRVAEAMRFEPALDREGRPVKVWTTFPIQWRASGD